MSTKTTESRITQLCNGLMQTAAILSRIERFLTAHEYDGGEEGTWISLYTTGTTINFSVYGEEGQRELMAELRRQLSFLGGKWQKGGYGDQFTLRLSANSSHPAHPYISISADRQSVCERKVVGKETKVIPAVEAQPERTEEVEVVEWDCGTLLDDAA